MRRYHCGSSISRTGPWQRQQVPLLDLDRGERGLAGVTPVDVARAAVDQAGLEQRQEQPLRPAVHDRVGAEERALPVEGEAEALSWPVMCSAQRLTQSLGDSPRGDRAELGGQAEGVEAEREQHVVAARAAKARVGVADRVAAHVADVDVAGGERRGGLDVQVRLLVEPAAASGTRRARARRPGGGLDRVGVIARGALLAHVDRAYPRA